MQSPDAGPSSDAWGALLSDPWLVKYQGLLIAFARAASAPTDTLYFQVLDPQAAMNAADESAWNGWYRFEFPEAPPLAPGNERWSAEQPPPELRLAGMDLLTVTPIAQAVEPADASFQVFSDDRFLTCFRPSAHGTLYLTRLMLASRKEEVFDQQVTRYALEPAWEVRYQRSGLRDVPEDDTDTQSYLDLTGRPFYEPTLELSQIGGIQDGAYAVARVPTADAATVAWYLARTGSAGVQLFRFTQTDAALTDFSESPRSYTEILPSLAPAGETLAPIAGVAPGLVFYAEQDGGETPSGQLVELERAGRLMLAIPVAGAGLTAATAIYDFSIGADGDVPDLPSGQQSVLLVDGVIEDGAFVPDTTSPSFPTPAQAAATVQVVDGLTVDSLLLGQVQPHTDLKLGVGDDGVVHLYHGGPPATEEEATIAWSALVPGVPQAMVAQFDPRVSRLVIDVPWEHSMPSEQPPGAVHFVARQSGPVMEGATVAVSDVAFGSQPQPDLCAMQVTYPTATGLPAETWVGVPREVAALAQVLDGGSSDDSADPDVLAGNRPFFDFSGRRGLARAPALGPGPQPAGVFPPALTFVSTRPSIALTELTVAGTQVTLAFRDAEDHSLTQVWTELPATVDAYPSIFGGDADPASYDYAPGHGSTPLFALATDAYGIPAPLLLFPTGAGPNVAELTIAVAAGATEPGTLDVTFDNGGTPVTVSGVAPAVDGFVTDLEADAEFQTLGLAINAEGVAGNVMTTAAGGAVGLDEAAALFDLVMPAQPVVGCAVPDATYAAGRLGHVFSPSGDHDPTRLVGFAVSFDAPEAGAPAYITNQAPATRISRAIAGRVDAGIAQSGAWIRQMPQLSCAFDGTNAMTVPVASQRVLLPQSANLQPQWDWTLEAWIQPTGSAQQRLVTFLDGLTPVPAWGPQLEYRLALQGAGVVQFDAYAKQPGKPDSSYFQTGSAAGVYFLPAGSFTWEAWLQPQAVPAPPGSTALGGVIEVIYASIQVFSVGLTADRHVVLRVSDGGPQTRDLTSAGVLAEVDGDGQPDWSHIAVVASQDDGAGAWTLLLYIDAVLDSTFTDVALAPANDPRGMLIIGRNTPDDASLYGQVAHLRLWDTARTPVEIRRTAFTSLAGTEAGLLGCWPLSAIDSGGRTGEYARNLAWATKTDWDADLYRRAQDVAAVADDVFLSVVASVAELPTVEAQALLVNGRWNHLAVVFEAGGALDLNPLGRFLAGEFDWMTCAGSDDLTPGSAFAVDAWVAFPAGGQGYGTILSRWAWDDAPEDRSYELQIDPEGNLLLTVNLVDTDLGDLKTDWVRSSGVQLLDTEPHHVAAVFAGEAAADEEGATGTYTMRLYVDGQEVGKQNGKVQTATVQVQPSEADVFVGRTYAVPEGAEPPAVENLALFRGILGRLRFWGASPSFEDLFPELSDALPAFGPPAGLAAQWDFRDQEGTLAGDSIGGNDGQLTSSAPWSSLRVTSALTFYANGGVVGSVDPYEGPLTNTFTPQFSVGTPAESGVAGFAGEIATLSLWGAARSLETVQDQQYVPLDGDEPGLLAAWDFAAGGMDITGGQNDASPPIDPSRIAVCTAPISNEGPYVTNVYGGVTSKLSRCTPGRIAVDGYVDVQQFGTQSPLAVLKRQYLLDPLQAFSRAIQVGPLDLVYVGQVQTQPTLIGFIEGAPPVPSENLSRPYYLGATGPGYTAYFNTAAVTLTQQGSERVVYSSSTASAGQLDFKGALGIFGISRESSLAVPFVHVENSLYNIKQVVQLVGSASGKWGTDETQGLSAAWTATQRDGIAVRGDWEPFEADSNDYLNPQVGRRFVPDNVGYALVESLTADLYAVVFHATGAALGTIVVPNLAIPPDRNVLQFPIDPRYIKAGTLDGKVGLFDDPDWKNADQVRGSYFRPAEAYALAAAIEQENERNRAYARQFDPETRGKRGESGLGDVRGAMPVAFEEAPRDAGQTAVPATGIANRYVWSAEGGLHVEEQGYAGVASRSHGGFRERAGGGGITGQGEFFMVFGFAWSLDLMAQHSVDIHVGLDEESQQTVGVDLTVMGESYLPTWSPTAPAQYGTGTGAFLPGLGPGKVRAYRFMTFYLPPSTRNAAAFAAIVDPVWKRLSNDPTARALRELDAFNPAWRMLHRVTYVERVPPPIASRPVYTVASDVREPVNVPGNLELLRLIDVQLGPQRPVTPAAVGAAAAAVLNPAPTSPGQYPPSILQQHVAWWATFLDAARPPGGTAEAAALLASLVSDVVDYALAGYQTGVLPR